MPVHERLAPEENVQRASVERWAGAPPRSPPACVTRFAILRAGIARTLFYKKRPERQPSGVGVNGLMLCVA